jgi:hypothetical protein
LYQWSVQILARWQALWRVLQLACVNALGISCSDAKIENYSINIS